MDKQRERELHRTRPDYLVYVPESADGSTDDGSNEHFLVFDGPDGSLMAIWTQARAAAHRPVPQVNRIVFSRSVDEGATWTPPTLVAGPRSSDNPATMASWAFPLVSASGRIYVVFNWHTGVSGWLNMHTGIMGAVCSDDAGATWSEPQAVPMPPSPYDDPTGHCPPEWIVWQKPLRDRSGGWLVGYTHWVNPAVATRRQVNAWTEWESVCECMRFTNVDADPEPGELQVRYSAWGSRALRVPHYRYPLLSVAQEPGIVRLPDGRLFCVMRTGSGYLWWSESRDDGDSWCGPRPLLNQDFGLPLLNPVGCAPLYALSDGRYVLFYSNNRGDIDGPGASDAGPRRPVHIAVGEFRPGAEQPLWFSAPRVFMDSDDVGYDGVARTPETPRMTDMSLYASFTNRGGKDILWYPDRKHFLLGRRITAEVLEGLAAPVG